MTQWKIDAAHSEIVFKVKHLVVSTVSGHFDRFDARIESASPDFSDMRISFEADVDSINTKNGQRDGHLKSPDFFDAEKYPYLTFKSTRVEVKDASHARLIGDLTIRDVTKEVSLDVEYNGSAKSPWGTTNAGFSGKTTIKRKDWGLNWNVALETGGWLVGDDIHIAIELEIVQQPEAVPAEAVAA